jgi:hypothetical protein
MRLQLGSFQFTNGLNHLETTRKSNNHERHKASCLRRRRVYCSPKTETACMTAPRLQVGDLIRLKEPQNKPDGAMPTTARIVALNHGGIESVTRLSRG